MLRLSEIGLFLTPLALFVGFYFLGSRARWLLWVATALLVTLGSVVVWLGVSQRLAPHQVYVPARMQNGHIVEGHGG